MMRLQSESPHVGIHEGTLVMNFHHGLMRFGVVEEKTFDTDGWAQCKVRWLEDHIHQSNTDWNKKMRGSFTEPDPIRIDWLKPVSAGWLQNVLNSYEEYENDRRTEFS
jgi:hypothetical protein